MSERPLRPYVPPTDEDVPLDAVEEALVRMWIRVLLPVVREMLAGQPDERNDQPSSARSQS